MKILKFSLLLAATIGFLFYCSPAGKEQPTGQGRRGLVDTVGFAHLAWQTDSVMARIRRLQGDLLDEAYLRTRLNEQQAWKVAISPHDDYTYVGYLYPAVLRNVKAPIVILFGVAHKARKLNLENRIIFDSYAKWRGPYGDIPVSPLREAIIVRLPQDIFQINNRMQGMEHSVEAILPFLQYFNRKVQIVSILVPYMSYRRMDEIARPLAAAIHEATHALGLSWGKDFALVISTDAVHYGDRNWGGKNFAFYGADSGGYKRAVAHESEIINNCLIGALRAEKLERFTQYTVKSDDYKAYKWTWCGRYSVPFGLLTAFYLQQATGFELNGTLVGYATSIDHPHLPVDDLRMGVTAPANIHHWVGYAAIGYR